MAKTTQDYSVDEKLAGIRRNMGGGEMAQPKKQGILDALVNAIRGNKENEYDAWDRQEAERKAREAGTAGNEGGEESTPWDMTSDTASGGEGGEYGTQRMKPSDEQAIRDLAPYAAKEAQARYGQPGDAYSQLGAATAGMGNFMRDGVQTRKTRDTPDEGERLIQEALLAKGYKIGDAGADGYLGPDTLKAMNDKLKQMGYNVEYKPGDRIPWWAIQELLQ